MYTNFFFIAHFFTKGEDKNMNRFGIREICDLVFKPLTSVDLGGQHFDAGQPMLYIDTAKTSSLEGASSTVYAQGKFGCPVY